MVKAETHSTSRCSLFSLALLVPIPGPRGHPHFPLAILPTLDNPEWEAALLQDSLDVPRAVAAAGLRPRGPLLEFGPEDPRPGLLRELVAENSWRQEGMRRGQRGDLERRPLGPFPGHPMDTLHYQKGGEEGGGNGNRALTSPAGFRLSTERREALDYVLEGSKKGGGTKTCGGWGTRKWVRQRDEWTAEVLIDTSEQSIVRL